MSPTTTRIDKRIAAIAATSQAASAPAIPNRPNASSRDQRDDPRRPVFRFARLVTATRTEIACIVTDISAGGARITFEGEAALPETVKLKIIQTGETRRARVAWQREKSAGLSFIVEPKPAFGVVK